MRHSGDYVMLPGARLEMEGGRPVETLGGLGGCNCHHPTGASQIPSAGGFLGAIAIIGVAAALAYWATR